MKFIYILCFAQLATFTGFAQGQPVQNSLRTGIDIIPIDGLTSPALRYQLRYGKHLFSDRFVIGASLGYLRGNGREKMRGDLYGDLYYDGNVRRRVTGDISVLYDLLPSARHALRVGGGPSVSYRQDNVIRGASFSFGQNGVLISQRVDRSAVEGFLIGYHILVEYEQALSTKVALGGRIGFTDAKHDIPILQAGIGASYFFR